MECHRLELFLGYANDEYEKLSQYCNNLSNLSGLNKISSQHSSTSSIEATDSTLLNRKVRDISRSQYLTHAISISPLTNEETTFVKYYDALNELREAHSKLVKWSESSQIQHESNSESLKDTESFKLASEHLQLSGRVLRTCACSSESKGYGPLFENGMVKNLAGTVEDWHEIRIVALVALRGSISKIKRYCKQRANEISH